MSEELPAIAVHDVEAEQSVLGALMCLPATVPVVTDILRADDFYRDTHRRLYAAICVVYAQGGEPDPITVGEELRASGELEAVGGKAYVHTLVDFCPTATQAPRHAHIVRECAVRRGLAKAAAQIAERATDGDVEDLLGYAERLVFEVSQRQDGHRLVQLGQALAANYERIQRIQAGEHRPGLATGLRSLDYITGGLHKDNLVILAARPAVGKSAMALTIALHIAGHGTPVVYFSLEMSVVDVADRVLGSLGRVPIQKFRCGGLTPDEQAAVVHTMSECERMPLYIDDTPVLTPLALRSTTRRLAMREPLGLVIVDYLQLMVGAEAERRRQDNRQQEVADISRQLKALARELDCPVLALSQLNRNPEMRADKRPGLADLRESGAIEQDADLVIFLHHPKDAGEHIRELNIAKHRNGPTSLETVAFEAAYTRFSDIDTSAE